MKKYIKKMETIITDPIYVPWDTLASMKSELYDAFVLRNEFITYGSYNKMLRNFLIAFTFFALTLSVVSLFLSLSKRHPPEADSLTEARLQRVEQYLQLTGLN